MSTDELIVYSLLGIAAAVVFALRVLFLLTLARCLQRIHPNNRKLQPLLVWLDLVPVFNLVWGFVMVRRIAESLAAEFDDRGLCRWGGFGLTAGTAWMWSAVGTLLSGGLAVISVAYFWVWYWLEIARYSARLAEAGGDEYDDFDADAE